MITKIIFINYEQITNTIIKEYYFDYFENLQINVQYCDISSIITNKSNILNNKFQINISNYEELENFFSTNSNKNTLVIPMFYLMGHSLKIYRLFSKYDFYIGFFCWGTFPIPQKSYLKKIIQSKFSLISYKNLITNFISRQLYKFGFIKKFDIVFTAGSVAKSRFIDCKTRDINFIDYNNYLKINKLKENSNFGNYAVFLDNNAAFHNDVSLHGAKLINAEKYFNELNSFFTKIERKYNVKIIIASHPSSIYDNTHFNGRTHLKFRTAELVKNSKFVLTSISTAFSFAIFFNKPIIFFYTQEMLNNYYNFGYPDVCNYLAIHFNFPVYNISKNILLNDNLQTSDANIRDRYINEYFTSNLLNGKINEEVLIGYLENFIYE